MNNEIDDSLDLLDLEDDATLDTLPESSPFTSSPRPKKPWLLMGIGLLVIVLATYIIVRTIGSDSGSSVEIDLDTPEVVTVDSGATDTLVVPDNATPTQPAPVAVTPAPKRAEPTPVTPGVPVREVSDRREITFNPDKPAGKPAIAAPTKPKAQAPKPKPAANASWYVQFGSYSTRALAERAQKKIQAGHPSLFTNKQFVILAAVLPNGTTTYRLRIGFATSGEANGFCQNAKSDGLDCYVAK
ncbi:MAG: SPOR domain-containing protein [Rickettsiales bacterium]|nr:SPOR domain-containing protein [Rickettsiales bacterium]